MPTKFTTPFPAIPGSPVSKTEDRYFCRDCRAIEYADYIEATGSTTCAWCDSENVITAERHAREEHERQQEVFAQMDREAEARYAKAAEPTYSEGCLLRRQAS